MAGRRSRHPKKEIEAAVRYAESLGWTFVRTGSHVWGILRCPSGNRADCTLFVQSTPRVPREHADQIRRAVDLCSHMPPN